MCILILNRGVGDDDLNIHLPAIYTYLFHSIMYMHMEAHWYTHNIYIHTCSCMLLANADMLYVHIHI